MLAIYPGFDKPVGVLLLMTLREIIVLAITRRTLDIHLLSGKEESLNINKDGIRFNIVFNSSRLERCINMKTSSLQRDC